MAWFRPMGVESVDYHRETVKDRGDDHPGQALDYYGSRGETPLIWGGQVAAGLGLVGTVTEAEFDAAFGPGGFRDPLTGKRLVRTTRPGFELVVAAHKTVAMLGVIDRADDMHAILDAETTATMDWLEEWFQARGGRRGRAATPTPTAGLAYAVTRHGTSRAGDPNPHDHVLIANITEMLDERGGYKGLYSALLRDSTEAATMVGRLHSAAKAIELGYAIEADDGPSGRLRHWRIAGIPVEVCEIYSKRADDIDRYLAEHGYEGYRARNYAARQTRQVKRHTGVDELMPRWHQELTDAGWSVQRLAQALETARDLWRPLRSDISSDEVERLAGELLDPEGEFLARGKVFTRTRLIAEIAPRLYGYQPEVLGKVVDRILASPLVVPLIGVGRTAEQCYTASAVLEAEHAIAATIERLIEADGPQLYPERILRAIAAKQDELGRELTDGQYAAVNAICQSGRAVDVIVGIAGSGKTTALDAATTALTEAGYEVIGTAAAGQAARTLGRDADIEARTMASLLARLDSGSIKLTSRSVVIVDEAGMAADANMARLLWAVEAAGAKVVIVGDDHQLSPVGPGGALGAILAKHPEIVTTLTENVRQTDPAERDALLELRSGDIDTAVDFYAQVGRIETNPNRVEVMAGMVDAWADDITAGHNSLLLAWRRNNVADLNRFARDKARTLGWISGPDHHTPDGRAFAVGDRVVTLAPNYRNQLVTSERGHITAIDPEGDAITVRTDEGRQVTLIGSEIAADRLDYGYAITVHREQGDTSDTTHYLADGGGRELAYVALSRARQHTTVHVPADDLEQAIDDLTRDWSNPNQDQWLTPTSTVGHDPAVQPTQADLRARRNRILDELEALHQLPPPDVTSDLESTTRELDRLRRDRQDLAQGVGRWRREPAGRVARQLRDIDTDLTCAQQDRHGAGWPQRRKLDRLINTLHDYQAATIEEWDQLGQPHAHRLDEQIERAEHRKAELEAEQRLGRQWHRENPDHAGRVEAKQQELRAIDAGLDPTPALPAVAADQQDQPPEVVRMLERFERLRQRQIDPPSIADGFGL